MIRSALAAAAFILAAGSASAQTPLAAAPAAAPAPNDYAKPETWLCRPGQADVCAGNLDATIVYANGKAKIEPFKPARDPKIDCFYVYPTVSRDQSIISDMNAGPEERNVALIQAARFTAKCRLFAPLYRQFTTTALLAYMSGRPLPGDAVAAFRDDTSYKDVRDAWRYYLEHDNNGRGVVLIGHSQGSGMLARLIAEEIDGKPAQAKLVSAIIPGETIQVPRGKDVGGRFKAVPLCRKRDQTGCVIAYSTFRDTAPPPAKPRFGAPEGETVAACVNPGALAGGEAKLNSYFAANVPATVAAPPWAKGVNVTTHFVRTPGLISALCTSNANATYLQIHVNADPADPRVDDIQGDLPGPGGKPLQDWGLHLTDVGLALGDLVDIVGDEAKAYKPVH